MWKSIYTELPVDQTDVWIRVLAVYGQLALAKWDSASMTFTVIATQVEIPVYFVGRWKNQ